MKKKSQALETVVHGVFLLLGLITVGCVLLISVYLIVSGIPAIRQIGYTQGGQSDALFLLVVNNKTEQLQVISINRNTMADIELCDEEGIDMGPLKTQICLQHAFGDGKRLSCSKTVDAVSGLFQNIPISGYLAMKSTVFHLESYSLYMLFLK